MDNHTVDALLSHFFPPEVLRDRPARLDLGMMALLLSEMGQEPLRPGQERLRVLCAPAFEPVMCVLVENVTDSGHLTSYVRADRDTEVAVVMERRLSSTERDDLRQAMQRCALQDMPLNDDRVGLDGEFWLIETTAKDAYHAVFRWSPDIPGPEAEFLTFGVAVLTLGGFSDRVKGWLLPDS